MHVEERGGASCVTWPSGLNKSPQGGRTFHQIPNDRETRERTKTSVDAVGGDQTLASPPLLAYIMLLLPFLASLLHSQILRTAQIRLLHSSKSLINFTAIIVAQIGACVLSLGDFGGAATV